MMSTNEIEFLKDLRTRINDRLDELSGGHAATPENRFRVLLDIGHSDSDPGATNDHGTIEYELNQRQAQVIVQQLKGSPIEIWVVNPNPDDLESIGLMIADFDCLLSLHHNSYSGFSDPGTECWVHTSQGAPSHSNALAEIICDHVSAAIQSENRGVKRANFTVLRAASIASKSKPAVLVESFFINKYKRLEAMIRSEAAAVAIAKALKEYFGV